MASVEEDLTKNRSAFHNLGAASKNARSPPWFSSRNEEQREVTDVKNEEAYIQNEVEGDQQCTVRVGPCKAL